MALTTDTHAMLAHSKLIERLTALSADQRCGFLRLREATDVTSFLGWLKAQTLGPRLYWHARERDREFATLGCLRELDSLADVISFGVAPAIIAYGCGMQGLYDRIVLAYFVACGVSRLARYNVTAETLSGDDGKVKYFEGTPIPTSIVLVGLLALAAWLGAVRENLWFGKLLIGGFTLHPLVLLFALSGSLMISRIRIPKL